jgi:hypothetical protein
MTQKMQEIFYNVHDLVKIKVVTSNTRVLTEIESHLREFQTDIIEEKDLDIYLTNYKGSKLLDNPIVVSDYYYYSNNWIDIPKEKIRFNIVDDIIKVQCEKMLLPLNLLVEIILLRKGYSFLHSAGFSYKGNSYIIPTFGGVGKTLTISRLIYKGAKLFGDDLVIISLDNILSYPLDFSIYPYHLNILEIDNKNIQKELRNTERIDNIIDKIKNSNDNKIIKLLKMVLRHIRKPYLSIPPRQIFGGDIIQSKGELNKAIFLLKKEIDSKEIIINEMSHEELALISTDILLAEWHASLHLLLMYSGLSDFSFNDFRNKIHKIFHGCFSRTDCVSVIYPTKLDLDEYINQLESNVLKDFV